MVSSRGARRPPVPRSTLAGTLGAMTVMAAAAAPAVAQPSPTLAAWLRATSASAAASAAPASSGPQAEPVLAPAPEARGPIPPGAVIGEVRVATRNIFDPSREGEDRRIFRLANWLHRTTRPRVVEGQLLFKPGDVFSPELIEESARLLRAHDYLYDVDIKPVLRDDGKVDVEVVTRDVWTLQGGVTFGRAGGVNTSSFSVEDSNLLGTGKSLQVSRIETVDRTSNLLRYQDPNVWGSRLQMLASYADNSDGSRTRFELERPFYSLDSRWAAGVRTFRDDRVEQLYSLGKVTTGFRHRTDFLELYGGFSPGLADGVTRRWQAGFTWERDRFAGVSLFPTLPPIVTPTFQEKDGQEKGGKGGLLGGLDLTGELPQRPPDRQLAYPWVRYGSVEDRFVVERDLDRLQRSEDLNLGRQWHLLVGYSSPLTGGVGRRWIGQGAVSSGWRPGAGQLLLAQVGASTRWGGGDVENLVAGGSVRWYWRDFGRHVLFASAGADLAHRLDGESQILLGGDSGLRGYPLRYQAGDRRLLFTVEQRFYSERELFHLVVPGAAVFFDAGKAWFVDAPNTRQQQLYRADGQLLKDIGLGLRLGSSRSSKGAVVHLDVAFPLDGGRNVQRAQWLVTTKDTF